MHKEEIIGYLKPDESGRYEAIDIWGNYLTYYTSGDGMVVYIDGAWHEGRVEYADNYGGYYFIDENRNPRRLETAYKVKVEVYCQ